MADPCRILLVDDEEDACMILGEVLADRGCEVSTTSSPREAVRIGCERVFDLVVLDIKMPEMNGVEVLRRIRGKGHRQIVMLTGYTDAALESQAFQEGAAAVLYKPVDLEGLFQRIAELCPDTR